ncbi:MAG TPA: Calx-beta domain-containing protein [Thermoanaerobaculia bacterium]|nr:Calx-beta domain-containing protein [Thermoanaerobaculia bacterium]
MTLQRIPRISALTTAIALSVAIAPGRAENHRVRVLNDRFDPPMLTIQTGDTVTWTNVGGGQHNVRADSGQFRCAQDCDDVGPGGPPDYDPDSPSDNPGDPSTANWSSTVEFDRKGEVPYHCEVHGGPGGVGMSGVVVVGGGSSGGGAGIIELTSERFTVREDLGPATVRVRRTDGSSGAVGARLTAGAGTATPSVDFTPVSEVLQWADGATGERSVQVPILDDLEVEGVETVSLTLTEVTGGATLGRANGEIRITDDDSPDDSGDGGVLALTVERSAALEGGAPAVLGVERTGSLQGRVTVEWSVAPDEAAGGDLAAPTGGTLVWESGEGGVRSFEVTATADEAIEVAESARVSLANPTGGASLGAASEATIFLVDAEDGPCVSDTQRLCLNGGRFVVRTQFAAPEAGLAAARSVELTDDSGYFTFFDESNVESVIKVLAACGVNDRYWVFAAGLTNVEVRLSVVDTAAAEARIYVNPQGTSFLPIQDTSAFATCP